MNCEPQLILTVTVCYFALPVIKFVDTFTVEMNIHFPRKYNSLLNSE